LYDLEAQKILIGTSLIVLHYGCTKNPNPYFASTAQCSAS